MILCHALVFEELNCASSQEEDVLRSLGYLSLLCFHKLALIASLGLQELSLGLNSSPYCNMCTWVY